MVTTLYDMELDFLDNTSRVLEKILHNSVVSAVLPTGSVSWGASYNTGYIHKLPMVRYYFLWLVKI